MKLLFHLCFGNIFIRTEAFQIRVKVPKLGIHIAEQQHRVFGYHKLLLSIGQCPKGRLLCVLSLPDHKAIHILIHQHHTSGMYLAGQDIPGRHRFHIFLQVPFQGPRTVHRVVSIFHNIRLCLLCQPDRQFLIRQSVVQICKKQVYNVPDVVLCQRLEQDRFIQSIQKLRTKMRSQLIHYLLFALRTDLPSFVNAL